MIVNIRLLKVFIWPLTMQLIQPKEVKNLRKSLLTLFAIFLIITSGVNFVSAQNITEEIVTNYTTNKQNEILAESNAEQENKNRIGESVKSQENGHFNISFDDGYNGYCINYGKNEANNEDEFIVQNTTSAINNKNGESVGHYLKTFFVEFHDIAVKNKIDTQKIIWSFTDDFKFNDTLIQQIKDASLDLIIPDHGAIKKINNTTEAVFDFEVLSSTKLNHQNFFAYKITYRNITMEILNNTTEKEENETGLNYPIFDSALENKTENTTIIQIGIKPENNGNVDLNSNNENKKSNLQKYSTGNPISTVLGILLLFGTIIAVKYKRD